MIIAGMSLLIKSMNYLPIIDRYCDHKISSWEFPIWLVKCCCIVLYQSSCTTNSAMIHSLFNIIECELNFFAFFGKYICALVEYDINLFICFTTQIRTHIDGCRNFLTWLYRCIQPFSLPDIYLRLLQLLGCCQTVPLMSSHKKSW